MVNIMSPRPQIALVGETAQDFEAVAQADGIDWLICSHETDLRYRFTRDGRTLLKLDLEAPVFDLPDLVAILGVSDRVSFQRLEAAWLASLPTVAVALEWIEDPDPVVIVRRALHHLSRTLSERSAYAGRMAIELANYRREFERMQHCFVALEDYVTANVPQHLRVVFNYPRSDRTVAVGSGVPDLAAEAVSARVAVSEMQQLLPVNSTGMAGLSISLRAVPGADGLPLEIGLSAIETGQTIATWSLDPVTAVTGWAQLLLERAIDEPALSLVLGLASQPASEGWVIALGPPHPYAEFCAQTAGGESLGAPLAMQVLTMLPGTRVPAGVRSVLANGARHPDACALDEADYATVTEVFAPDADVFAHYNREAGFIQVHPRGLGKVTVARLQLTAPAGTWRLSAHIRLAHEMANPTLFAMLVRPACDAEAKPADITAVTDGAEGFSGWTTLSAMEEGFLSVVLPRVTSPALTVYLLTRQDGGPEYGWARFSDMRLHYLPSRVRGGMSADGANRSAL